MGEYVAKQVVAELVQQAPKAAKMAEDPNVKTVIRRIELVGLLASTPMLASYGPRLADALGELSKNPPNMIRARRILEFRCKGPSHQPDGTLTKENAKVKLYRSKVCCPRQLVVRPCDGTFGTNVCEFGYHLDAVNEQLVATAAYVRRQYPNLQLR